MRRHRKSGRVLYGVPPHPVLLPEGRRIPELSSMENSRDPSPLGERAGVRGSLQQLAQLDWYRSWGDMKAAYKILAVLIACALAGFAAAFYAGSVSSAPAPSTVGSPPPDLPVEAVSFESGSGSRLSGWFLRGQPHRGGVLLMHGIRANRLEMLGRARMLHGNGFSVLLFDFQAHGESPGQYLTFGFLVSRRKGGFRFLAAKATRRARWRQWACPWGVPRRS